MMCEHDDGPTLFCARCGKVRDAGDLKTLRFMAFVGVEQSTNPKIENFWRSGDPADLA